MSDYNEAMSMYMDAYNEIQRYKFGSPKWEELSAELERLEQRKNECCPCCGEQKGSFVPMRYSMGLPAGKKCKKCWDNSSYRKVGADAFDPGYAGESYDEDY